MLGLGRYKAKICACGFHESIASDPENHFTFDQRICPVCKGSAQYDRVLQDADERQRKQMGDNTPANAPRLADGRHVRTRRMSPQEIAERRASSPGSTGRP
jgi:hypothetical protein